MSNDTIVALATAPGESALAITRLSGSRALAIAASRFRGRVAPTASESHRVLFGSFLGSNDTPLDTVLLSVFRAPHSYTGEDIVEISSHGGATIPRAILESLIAAGARPARPGEFTERAFRNGKLDLAQAESVAALIGARSERSLRAARSALGGALSRKIEALDAELVSLLAEIEARIDFPADAGEPMDATALTARCSALAASVREWVHRIPGTRRIHGGLRAALVGRPNVGKSSLLNAIVGYDRAIVSESPGTTRDTVEETVEIDGIELRVLDTAGIRGASDPVERMGVDRSRRAGQGCDLAVLVLDRSEGLHPEDCAIASDLEPAPMILAWNKSDLPRDGNGGRESGSGAESKTRTVDGSCLQRDASILSEVETVAVRPGGAEPLLDAIRAALPTILACHAGEDLATTSARQELSLIAALEALERAESGFRDDLSYDLIAVDLADARRALGEIVGRGVDDAVVAAVFSRFCIGK